MTGYRFVNLEGGRVALYRIVDGALDEQPVLRGTVGEMERELGLWPGTLRRLDGRRSYRPRWLLLAGLVLAALAALYFYWN